ncbi:MAG TPA: M20/M25/M40 family metallo-hydrolase [Longimicrobium sp.]|nr:M20/M25/M40 family metallo-hydrolase [Longimicrobium sp.]
MKRLALWAMGAAVLAAAPLQAQPEWTTSDPVLRGIWEQGTQRSQLEPLAQALLDSLGPRLTASAGMFAAQDWVVRKYAEWGITARNERYGTWRGWNRGYTHLDLLTPRVRTLEAMMLAWSPGTTAPVEAGVVILPDVADSVAFRAWLPNARGKLVMISFPPPTCRPDENWQKWAVAADFQRFSEQRTAAAQAWTQRVARTGLTTRDLPVALEQAGAAGILTNLWSAGWGVEKIFNARTRMVPTVDLSCEDYGLVYRLAANGDNPTLRMDTRAEFTGEETPVSNTIAQVRGTRKPDEYIMLSAHFDSWDGSSGGTDNGTGTIVMMEAMRILREVYPRPNRTIVVGHWSGEEQGLVGSRSFAEDHPEIVRGLHALFNQDNGTGRIRNISMQGFTGAAPIFRRWLAAMPPLVTDSVNVDDPGMPSGGGSDNASFVCHGAPAFGLGSLSWDYGTYTWHTNRDTYDKISFDDVRRNALMVAMLVYLADQEPELLPRDRRTEFPVNQQTGQPGTWPECPAPPRSAAQSTR